VEAVVSLCSEPGGAGADSLNSHGFSVSSIKARWVFRYKCVSQCTPHHQLLAYWGKGALLCLQHENDGRIFGRHWYTLSEHQLKSVRLSIPLVLPTLYMMNSRVKKFCGSPSFSRIPPRARLPNSKISYANDNIEALSLSGMTGPLRSNDQEHGFM
jgi:hypothetical protein